MADLIDRTRMAAKILRDIGGQSAMAATVDEAADALEAAGEDACVALLTDIRWACGDKGKRMQPELVEFIRGLAEDAERLDWFDSNAFMAYRAIDPIDGLAKHCVVVDESKKPRRGNTGTIREALDAAREARNG